MVKVIIVDGSLGEILESLTAAKHVGDEIIVLAHSHAANEKDKLANLGVKTYVVNAIHPDPIYNAVKKLYDEIKPDVIIGHGSKNNRDVLSRLAGLYDLPMATDVTSLDKADGGLVYKRGFLSERAVATEKIPLPAIVLVNPKVFQPAEMGTTGEVIELPVEEGPVALVEKKEKVLSGVNLEEAEIIVGVGRGFKKKEDLQLAFELADLLGAQVGASRPIAADYKWLPEDAWIGISGKRVAPKLYIAIGISGAPQHMAGVNNAKIIVAVNKDKSAPIFKFADYGVVADLYQFIPVLIKKLKEKKGA
jgi:electron transfer flavoprotein alpha subunit